MIRGWRQLVLPMDFEWRRTISGSSIASLDFASSGGPRPNGLGYGFAPSPFPRTGMPVAPRGNKFSAGTLLQTDPNNLEGRALRARMLHRNFHLPMHNRGVAELRLHIGFKSKISFLIGNCLSKWYYFNRRRFRLKSMSNIIPPVGPVAGFP